MNLPVHPFGIVSAWVTLSLLSSLGSAAGGATAPDDTRPPLVTWPSSQSNRQPRLSFGMASTLTFPANSVDKSRPRLAILFPRANRRVEGETLTALGKARDDVGVVAVHYQLNGAGWELATTTNNWTNWTAELTLRTGVNTLQAWAVDAVGNYSLTNTVKFVRSSSSQTDLAPSSLAGFQAQFTTLLVQNASLLGFGETNYSTIGQETEVGAYTYTKLDGQTAFLTKLPIAPPSRLQALTTNAVLSFTSYNQAHYLNTNQNGTTPIGFLVFSVALDAAPASLVGKTLRLRSPQESFTLRLSTGTFSGTSGAGAALAGSYTYSQQSPIGGLLVLSWTAPASRAGSVSYLVLSFSSSAGGRFDAEQFDAAMTELGTGAGSFSLR